LTSLLNRESLDGERLDLAVTDLGPVQLKNIAEPIRVYSVEVGQPAHAKPAPAPAPEKSAPPRLSMVVLPFANIEGSDGSSKFIFDLMEPERPRVDRSVLDFVRTNVFDPAGGSGWRRRKGHSLAGARVRPLQVATRPNRHRDRH
jgi:hypothetical protein